MTRISQKKGFTLLEILTALTIFLIIISVVYGSYITTIRSVDQCQTKITQAHEARSILTKMSQQIRCCYMPQSMDPKLITNNFPSKFPELQPGSQVLFQSQSQNSNGIILQFNTTAPISPTPEIPNGLVTVTYKYDAEKRKLFFRQQIFAPISQFLKPQSDWKVFGEHVANIKLNFLSDDKWLDKWDYQEKQILPNAVKITLFLSDTKKLTAEYCTIVSIIIEATKYTLSKNEKS